VRRVFRLFLQSPHDHALHVGIGDPPRRTGPGRVVQTVQAMRDEAGFELLVLADA
jgi:hypothetical protein